MSQRPLNLQLVIEILTYVSEHKGLVYENDLNPNKDEKDKQRLEQHFEALGDLDVVELEITTHESETVRGIKSLKSTGAELVELFKNKEALSQVTSQFGQEINGNELTTLLSMGSKILGDLLKRDPVKKAQRQEKRRKKREERTEEQQGGLSDSFSIADTRRKLLDEGRAYLTKYGDRLRLHHEEESMILLIGIDRDMDEVVRSTGFWIPQEFIETVRVDQTEEVGPMIELEIFNSNSLIFPGGDDASYRYFNTARASLKSNIDLALTHPDSPLFKLKEHYDWESGVETSNLRQKSKKIEPIQGAELGSSTKVSANPEMSNEFEKLDGDLNVASEPKATYKKQLNQQTAQKEFVEPLQEVESELHPTPPETIDNPLQLAHLNSDSAHKGKDLLGFEQDVEAFAAIMALEKLTPPLAIALFGQWGTGKSFFMQKLSEKVEELAKYQGFLKEKEEDAYGDNQGGSPEEKPFCEGICQIQFNAWSYMDTNLWASLVTRIFEGLDDYINDNCSEAQKEKDTIKSGIAEQLDVAKGQIAELEARKAQVQHAIDTLKDQVGTAQGELEGKIKEIKSTSRQKAINDAIAAADVKINLSAVLDKAGITKENLDQVNPELILKELKSAQTFVHQFLKFSRTDWLLVALGVLLFVVPGLIPSDLDNGIFLGLEKAGAILTLLVGGLAKVRNTANKLSPLVNGVLKIKNDYDTAVSEAISQHEQDILARRIEADQKEVELNQLNLQLKAKEAEIKEMAYKPDSVLAQKAMYNFITRKAASNDYSRHLGIISMIRKDFQTLSELFVESKKATKVPEKSKKKYEEFEKIREGFDKPLQRIVLYVDDLDRCPEERVVEVLEAVNLLMAFPLFVVVVGVDPRWVKNALIKKYHLQFTGHMKGSEKEVDNLGMEVINPSDYLEKIFQIPFHLKAPEDESIKNMITHLLGDAVQGKPEEPEAEEVGADDLLDIDLDAFFADKSAEVAEAAEEELDRDVNFDDFEIDTPAMAPAVEETTEEIDEELSDEKTAEDSEDNVPEGLKVVTPASLKLHWEEGEYMRNLSWLIGNTPRTVKRFVNMYRIIRAHEGLSYEDDSDKNDLLSIMFLLALQTGQYHQYSKNILTAIFNGMGGPTFGDMMEIEIHHGSDEDVKYEHDTYSEFLNELKNSQAFGLLKESSCTKIYYYSAFIRRFSFNIVALKAF